MADRVTKRQRLALCAGLALASIPALNCAAERYGAPSLPRPVQSLLLTAAAVMVAPIVQQYLRSTPDISQWLSGWSARDAALRQELASADSDPT